MFPASVATENQKKITGNRAFFIGAAKKAYRL
jgi:hypothetical protein